MNIIYSLPLALIVLFIALGCLVRAWADFWACFTDVQEHNKHMRDPDNFTLQPAHIRAMWHNEN